MMMGMGMPSRNNRIERIRWSPGQKDVKEGARVAARAEDSDAEVSAVQVSRCRPPQVAAKLDVNAPINSEANNHKAA